MDFMRILSIVLAILMLVFLVFQVRSRVPRIIAYFTPGSRKLFFQDVADPPIDEIHQEMLKPRQEQLAAAGFKEIGLMLEQSPLWSKGSREVVMVNPDLKIIASIGVRGLKLSYFLYTPFEGGEVVITSHNCFRNFVKPDFVTTEIKSGEIEEMMESHKTDVANFVEKGYVPFSEYTRESVIRATRLYYKAPYPSRQLRIAGVTNSFFFLLSMFVFYLLVRGAIG